MRYIRVSYISSIFCYSILGLTFFVFSFYSIADNHDTTPEGPKMGEGQNQDPSIQQNSQSSPDILNEEQEITHNTALILILCVLFLAILILLLFIFLKYRFYRKQVKQRLVHPVENNWLINPKEKENTLSESHINNVIQTFEDRLSELKHLLELLADENKKIQRSIENIGTTHIDNRSSQDVNSINHTSENSILSTESQGLITSSQDPRNEYDDPLSQVIQTFCELYNSRQENQLLMNYRHCFQIQVVNTLKRREDPKIPPIFETNERGKLWAFYIEDENLYAVVPIYSLTLERSVYGPGGFSEVFECPDFDPLSHYKNLTVVKPGIFKPDSNQQLWTLVEKGKLNLGSNG